MKKVLILSILLCFAGGSRPERFYYVDIENNSPSLMKELTEAGYDIGGINLENNTVSVIVPEEALSLLNRFKTRGTRLVAMGPDAGYKKPVQVETVLKQVESNYPGLARVQSIGKSHDGREIYAIEITNRDVTVAKKSILFDAMHHAREVMTTEVALDIVDYLTTHFATDTQVQDWLNSTSVWVVPMVNPDGNQKVWNVSSMWRKNNRGGYGVDNNRNYPADWNGCQGSSGSQSSDTYRGPSPASEPETQALMNLVSQINPVMGISYHSFSELVLYPYGCSPKHIAAQDRAVYEKLGRDLAKKLVRDSGSGTYTPGTPYELLYNADGGSIDWMYQSKKMMSFVVEMNSSNQGFQPSYSAWREKTVKIQRAGWQFLLDRMKDTSLPSRTAAKKR